ncbi:MAG TPA: AI-2E family transporter [Solirubrobacteraceae bacterium]|jgi:predicted PurR-regulated permease PerM|nr:AI-2E family transporter [Solirubrobacteraceae bacterium]
MTRERPAGIADRRSRPEALATHNQSPAVRLAAPSLRGVVRVVLIVIVCAILLYLAWRVRLVIELVGISAFVALAVNPTVDALHGKVRAPRALIILTIYIVLLAAVAVIGYVVVPSLVKEVQQLARNAPQYAIDLRRSTTFRHYDNRYHITATLVRDAHRLPQLLGHLAGPLKDVTVQAFSLVGQLVTVLALSFLLMLHGREYVNIFLSFTGARRSGIGAWSSTSTRQLPTTCSATSPSACSPRSRPGSCSRSCGCRTRCPSHLWSGSSI